MIPASGNVLLAGGDDSYNISRSLRFRSSASAYLNRTFGTPTNNKVWTQSFWVKRGSLAATRQTLLGATYGGVYWLIEFDASNRLNIYDSNSASPTTLTTTQIFVDPSAWYHIVIAEDTTQSVASNRTKVYVNGVQVTSFVAANYPAQNSNTWWNTASYPASIASALPAAGLYFDGYLAEVSFIDGQALTPSSFGETDAITGVWKPKKYAGTYGNNGFYLPFTNEGSSSTAGQTLSIDYAVIGGGGTYANGSVGGGYCAFGSQTITIGTFPVTVGGVAQSSSFNGVTAAAGQNGNNGGSAHWGWDSSTNCDAWPGGPGGGPANNPGGGPSVGEYYARGGDGGNGNQWSINGVYYGGGRGGARDGAGGGSYGNDGLGAGNFGGGGRAGGVIISYVSATQKIQGGTVTTSGGRFFHTFSSSGTISALVPNLLGNDYSGNGNHWTTNNISLSSGVTYDMMSDVPTLTSETAANYCVLNPLDNYGGACTLTDGNLTGSLSAVNGVRRATIGVSSGKWYWEATIGDSSNYHVVGVSSQNCNSWCVPVLGGSASGVGWFYAGRAAGSWATDVAANSYINYGSPFTLNDVIGVALNMDAGTITFYKNGVSQGVAYSNLAGKTLFPTMSQSSGSAQLDYYNFGQRPFSYAPPSGFKALNTFNLPDSTIKKGKKHFDVALVTGTGSNTDYNGVTEFQPGLASIKSRSASGRFDWFDEVRGAINRLDSSTTEAEAADNDLYAFNPTGFSGSLDNGTSYAAWLWKAGGTPVTNTSGSITSQVSANPSAGFSIVTYTGVGAARTVGHGLGVTPSMIIGRSRTNNGFNWGVWHRSLQTLYGDSAWLRLNTNDSYNTAFDVFDPQNNTSSVFGVGSEATMNASGSNYVAYCFASIPGYSAFGSYTGNGSADGTFVHLGFRPKWVMVKRTDVASSWIVWDSVRGSYNLNNSDLYPDLNIAEYASPTDCIDMLSNGFKQRGTGAGSNGSGNTFIYAAFAENHFKNSLAR